MQNLEKYSLTWNSSYSDHLKVVLKEMMTSKDFADVTLVTDDKQQIRAHRNILSACSPVFKNILQIDKNNVYPVIYLRGIQHSEMESIMQFIYFGEARFYEDKISEFLQVSKDLEIKDLSTHMKMNNEIASNEENENEHKKTAYETIIRSVKYDCNQCGKQFTHQSSLTTHFQSIRFIKVSSMHVMSVTIRLQSRVI